MSNLDLKNKLRFFIKELDEKSFLTRVLSIVEQTNAISCQLATNYPDTASSVRSIRAVLPTLKEASVLRDRWQAVGLIVNPVNILESDVRGHDLVEVVCFLTDDLLSEDEEQKIEHFKPVFKKRKYKWPIYGNKKGK